MLDLSAYIAAPGVLFTWGASPPQTYRYAGYDDDITVGADLWNAAPELEVDTLELSAGAEDKPFRLWLGASRAPGPTLLRPYEHAPVTVTVGDLIMVPGEAAVWQPLLTGEVMLASSDEAGRPALAQYQCSGPKALLDGRLGLPVLTTCRWVLGDQNCGAVRDTQSGLITAVANRTITVSGLVTPATVGSSLWWEFGDVTRDGLTITIYRQLGGGTSFELRQPPPPEWAGTNGVFRNGCRKDPDDCALKFSNIANFGGLAHAMDTRNPLVDEVG
jgi:hypothetical protein